MSQVKFEWKNPAGNTIWTDTVSLQSDGTFYDAPWPFHIHWPVYSANSTHTPEEPGEWTVKATFMDQHSHSICTCTCIVPKRDTSFFVIPEIPIIGTAGASIAMFAGLAVKMKRKPQK